MKSIKLKKVEQPSGTESNVPMGFEVLGITEIPPIVGERFKCGKFETGKILKIEDSKLYTKNSVYLLEVLQEKITEFDDKDIDIFDSFSIKESDELSDAIGMSKEEVKNLAAKVAGVILMYAEEPSTALEKLLKKMTRKELAFSVGMFLSESAKKAESMDEQLPESLKELMRKLGLRKDKEK